MMHFADMPHEAFAVVEMDSGNFFLSELPLLQEKQSANYFTKNSTKARLLFFFKIIPKAMP